MEEARKIWQNFRIGVNSEKEAVNRLLELIFTRKYEFGLSNLDEDSFSEFLIFMSTRLSAILKKYNPSICDFSTYLHSVLNLTAFWWKKKMHTRKEKTICGHNLCIEESFSEADFSPDEKDFYIEEHTADILSLKQAAMENLNCLEHKSERLTKKRINEILKVLALKSCNNISQEQIAIVAEITGTPAEELNSLIRQADDTLELKKNRISVMQSKRNYAYYNRKRKLLRETNMKNLYRENIAEYSSDDPHERRWKKALEDISVAAPNLVPSNQTVARLLHFSTRKVKNILDDAKEKLSDESIV